MDDDSASPNKDNLDNAYERLLTPGEVFGEYQILKCLSYTFLGALYEARKPHAQENELTYIIPNLKDENEGFIERYTPVVDKLIDLKHPNILEAISHSVSDGHFSITHANNIGTTPKEFLLSAPSSRESNEAGATDNSINHASLPLYVIKKFLSQILDGLGAAHKLNIFHLNLTPDNILVYPNNEVKLIGFGALSAMGDSKKDINIKTIELLSHEAKLGQNQTAQCDVYAIGYLAYLLLSCIKPADNFIPLNILNSNLNSAWHEFVIKCMSRRRNERFSTTKAALQYLDNIDPFGTKEENEADEKKLTAKSVNR